MKKNKRHRKRVDELKKFKRVGYDKEKLNEFYKKQEHQLRRLSDSQILVERLEFGKKVQITFDKYVYWYYPATNQLGLPKFNKLYYHIRKVDKFEEFVDKLLVISNRNFEGKEEYFDQNVENEPIEIIEEKSTIIKDVNLEILKYLSKDYSNVYNLTPRKFEEIIARILSDSGFDIELTGESRDGGKDIIAYFSNSVLSFMTYVECKRYAQINPVGVQTVRQVFGVQKMHNANKSLIVTTSYFTKDAIKEHNLIYRDMELKDHLNLKNWLAKYK